MGNVSILVNVTRQGHHRGNVSILVNVTTHQCAEDELKINTEMEHLHMNWDYAGSE